MLSYTFDKEDLRFEVEAWQYEEDEDVFELSGVVEDIEPKGEYFVQQYDNFDDAVKKYLELKKKGWEIVRFMVTDKKQSKDKEIRFAFFGDRLAVQVNSAIISKKCFECLKKVRDLINKAMEE